MNYWKILGIEKTTEKVDIKKAYRTKLKNTRPDEDEAGFMELRAAYEAALEYAENYAEEFEEKYEEDEFWDFGEEHHDYEFIKDEYTEWNIRLIDVWENLDKKYNPECWRKLLYEDAPYKLKYYEKARERIKNLAYKNTYLTAFLPVSVHKVIDGFFHFSTDDEVIIHSKKAKPQAWINIITRISSRINFSKIHKDANPETVDELLSKLYHDIGDLILENEVEFLDELELKYLPLDTLKISRAFDKYTEEGFIKVSNNLKKEYGDDIELELLMAERMLYNGETAKSLIKSLYLRLPETDLLFTFRLLKCCEKAGLLYEAYMLTKHALWMCISRGMNLKAEEISNLIEANYTGSSDEEHIKMCRMYLRSDRKKEALKILAKVKETNSWEYHMARALVYFNEKDIAPGVESYEILANYPKDELHFLQKLEWEELQGRYYFEKKEYEKAIAKCNEILRRYPESYPILILRSYADNALNGSYGNYDCMCDFWRVYSERTEVSLLVAKIFMGKGNYVTARTAIGEVKEKCELQYRYLELELFEGNQNELKKAWLKFLELIASKDFNIDVKNKYGLIDLTTIIGASRGIHWEVQEQGKYKAAIKKIYKSRNNNFGKELSKFQYYYLLLDDKNMLKEAKRCLKEATDIEEKEEALVELVGSYAMNGKFNEADKTIKNFIKANPERCEVLQRVYMRALTYCRFIQEYEKGIYYGLKFGNDMLSWYSAEILIEMIECYYYMGRKEPSYFEKAIEASDKLFSIWGKHYVDGTNDSPYVYLAYTYAEMGQVDKAMETLKFMNKYTENEFHKYNFNTYAFKMYVKAGMPEKAFEYVMKAKQEGGYIQIYREELGLMMIGRYEEAYHNLYEFAENEDDEDERSGDLYVCSMHSKYFMDGYIDRDFVLDIKAKVEEMLTLPNGDGGDNLFHLAHINNILGNEEAKKYEELAYTYSNWKSHDSREMCIQLYTLWKHWYNKEYEKAYQYCKDNIIFDNYFEVEYLEYFLKEMFEKGRLDDFRNRFRNQ